MKDFGKEIDEMKKSGLTRSQSAPPEPKSSAKTSYQDCQESAHQKAEAERLLQLRVSGAVKREDANVAMAQILESVEVDIAKLKAKVKISKIVKDKTRITVKFEDKEDRDAARWKLRRTTTSRRRSTPASRSRPGP